eukprot:2541282-Amphidinium_carterae.1
MSPIKMRFLPAPLVDSSYVQNSRPCNLPRLRTRAVSSATDNGAPCGVNAKPEMKGSTTLPILGVWD